MQLHAEDMNSGPRNEGIPIQVDAARRIAEMEKSREEWAWIRQMGRELASRSVDGLPLLSVEQVAELIRQGKEHLREEWAKEHEEVI